MGIALGTFKSPRKGIGEDGGSNSSGVTDQKLLKLPAKRALTQKRKTDSEEMEEAEAGAISAASLITDSCPRTQGDEAVGTNLPCSQPYAHCRFRCPHGTMGEGHRHLWNIYYMSLIANLFLCCKEVLAVSLATMPALFCRTTLPLPAPSPTPPAPPLDFSLPLNSNHCS